MLVLGQIIITKKLLSLLLLMEDGIFLYFPFFYSANTNVMHHFAWALKHIYNTQYNDIY